MEDLNPRHTGAAEASPPVRWLRNYSNYLSPRLGFFLQTPGPFWGSTCGTWP